MNSENYGFILVMVVLVLVGVLLIYMGISSIYEIIKS